MRKIVFSNCGSTSGFLLARLFLFCLPLAACLLLLSAGKATAQGTFVPTTILPTDVVPLPANSARLGIGENLQMRILQELPPQFYFNASVEATFRDETNPYQDPPRREYIKKYLPEPADFRALPIEQQLQDLEQLGNVDRNQVVNRVLPNITAGWDFTPATRVYCNYFFIRDTLFHSALLDTSINSIAYGAQHDFAIGKRASLQTDFQVRALFQHAKPSYAFYDFLPGTTLSYQVTPSLTAYVNTLLQLRGRWYFESPTREIDPFYTWGFSYVRGLWAFSANGTFLQNYRQPFAGNAIIDQNSSSIICDYEIDRRIFKKVSGAQSFVRIEPVYNFRSNQAIGLSGMDLRVYFGIRVAVSKPPISQALQQIREQVEEEEKMNKKQKEQPPQPPNEENTKPSAFIMPYETTAYSEQPIHGFDGLTVKLPTDTTDGISTLASLHSPESLDVDGAQVISNASSTTDVPFSGQSHLYAL